MAGWTRKGPIMSQNLSFQDEVRAFGAFTGIFNIYFLLVIQIFWTRVDSPWDINLHFPFIHVSRGGKKSKHEERYHHQAEQSGVWDWIWMGSQQPAEQGTRFT